MLFLSLLFASLSVQAASCSDLKTCAKIVTDLTGQKYLWATAHESLKLGNGSELDLTQENVEVLFTAFLDQLGLARIPLGDGKTFRILKGAEIKEIETPIFEASAEKRPDFGKTWDWITVKYKTKSPELAPYLEQAFRLHMPREARMQADGNTGQMILTGTIPVVRKMYDILKLSDKPMTAAFKKEIEEFNRERRRREMECAKK